MQWLSTSEFAKLCGTTKDTLFFYDRESLLKPKQILPNGYRRYSVEQFYEYDTIALLRETGSSLREIREHMQHRDPEKMLALCEAKKKILQQEHIRIKRQQKMLDDMLRVAREALHLHYDRLEIIEMPAERLEIVAPAPETGYPDESGARLFSEFIQHFESQGRVAPAPFGLSIYQADALAEHYRIGYFFCEASRATPKTHVHLKPAGLHAIWAHLGKLESHKAALAQALQAIQQAGYQIAGDIYAYDMMSYLITSSAEDYVTRYCIPIA